MHTSSSEKETDTLQQQHKLTQHHVTPAPQKPSIPTRFAVYVRLSLKEHQRLAADSQTFGKSLPDLLREGYFHGAPAAPLLAKADVRAVLAALSRIGNNINQIARQANSGSRATFASEFTALTEEVVLLNTALRSVCSGVRAKASGG